MIQKRPFGFIVIRLYTGKISCDVCVGFLLFKKDKTEKRAGSIELKKIWVFVQGECLRCSVREIPQLKKFIKFLGAMSHFYEKSCFPVVEGL